MNREYNSGVSSKKFERLLKNLKNTTGDYFFCRTLYSNMQWNKYNMNMNIMWIVS